MSKRHVHVRHLPELPAFTPLDTHQTWPRDKCGKAGALADERSRKEGGSMHGNQAPISTAPQRRLTESLRAMNSSSRVTMRNFTEGKEIRKYIYYISVLLYRPLFHLLFPAPVSILNTLAVTSDTDIPTCKIPWTMTYCLLQLHSHH